MNKEINIKIFPIQLIFKIKIEKIPKTNKISEFLIYLDLSFLPFPSIFIKYEIKTGLITRATNKDDNRVTIIPIGRKLINFPVNPGQNEENIELKKGLNIISNNVVYKEVSEAFNLKYTDISTFI